MADCQSPIGVFDSGLGGLSVYRHLKALLPHELFVYVADSAHAPYGSKSTEYIRQRSLAIARFLVSQDVKLIVVACNTATAAAVPLLREMLEVPIVAMEPGIKPAALLTNTGKIGVLATSGTLESERFAALHNRYGQDIDVFTASCEGWVELVERGSLSGHRVTDTISNHVRPLVEKGADTLILGCTHYPFLSASIQQAAGSHVQLVDTGLAVAKRVKHLLRESGLLGTDAGSGCSDQIYSSAFDLQLELKVQNLLGLWSGAIYPLPEGEA